ncbi:hypothetical protein BLNAU_11342 [Blattamonas nauphoetae]|uniref:Uncharacterized protein n=1 Tax=Blattamonas nauphoetae TaxID=2049346 RepID=A0ABQ9XSQ5_9EUKA|nr:hypothetical protein BLNAU_11342 [Blattamonas nauphoetae]
MDEQVESPNSSDVFPSATFSPTNPSYPRLLLLQAPGSRMRTSRPNSYSLRKGGVESIVRTPTEDTSSNLRFPTEPEEGGRRPSEKEQAAPPHPAQHPKSRRKCRIGGCSSGIHSRVHC